MHHTCLHPTYSSDSTRVKPEEQNPAQQKAAFASDTLRWEEHNHNVCFRAPAEFFCKSYIRR